MTDVISAPKFGPRAITYPHPINHDAYDWPTFSEAEFERRHNLVRGFMAEHDLDCLLVAGAAHLWDRGWANVRWITNYMGTMELDSFVIFPAEGEPTLAILGLNARLPDRVTRSIFGDVRGALNTRTILVDRLDELGLAENTLVVFLVDNGPDRDRYNAGLRGRKGAVFEGGIRSPLLARWPGHLPAGGEAVDRIGAHIDITPTLLDAAGVERPPGLPLDGRRLPGLPAGHADPAAWPDRTLYFQFHRGDEPTAFRSFAAVGQRYKLVHPSPRGEGDWDGELALELYDLEADPAETRNLIDDAPEIAAGMSDDYLEWFEDVSSTRPDNYAPPRIVVGTDQEPVTVLTRQDWRRITDDQGWRPTSRGRWLLSAREDATFDVEVRLVAGSSAPVLLDVGDRELSQDLAPDQQTATFDEVPAPAGDFALSAAAGEGEDRRGAHQVVLRRR